MKKLLVLILSLCLVAGCATTESTESTGMSAGTYTATATGYHGDITIDVTVSDTAIEEIVVVEESETEGIGAAALPLLVEAAVTGQNATPDAISGATITSVAFNEALTDALTQAGADLTDFEGTATDTAKEQIEETYDVVVVGAGLAGLSSALVAAQSGKSVVVLEKMGVIGGASAMAGGGTIATGSQWAIEDGSTETAEELVDYLLENGHYNNHVETVELYANTVGEAFDWFVSEDGANVPYTRSLSTRNYSVDGRGTAAVSSVAASLENLGIEILTSTPATELIIEDGVVTGVIAEGTTADYTLNATSVVLATGGYGNNDELVDEQYLNYVYAGAPGADGDALIMVESLNADLINTEFVNTQPNSMVLPSGLGQYTNPGVNKAYATSGAYIVNQDGVRFANEVGDSWDLIQAMAENTTNYIIMDQASFDAFNEAMIASNIYSEDDVTTWLENNGTSQPVMVTADSFAELETTLSLPEGSLTASATQYNEDVAAGVDEFGREVTLEIETDGPVYALQMWIRYYATLGGLHVNDDFQVLNTDLEAIEGLYAAGEVIGGLCGDIYAGGSLFSWAMTSGYGAGVSVSE